MRGPDRHGYRYEKIEEHDGVRGGVGGIYWLVYSPHDDEPDPLPLPFGTWREAKAWVKDRETGGVPRSEEVFGPDRDYEEVGGK
jgi:hypothetical protein